MKDKIIQLRPAYKRVYGLSESGVLYKLVSRIDRKSDRLKEEYRWMKIIESPEK
jgi:hypothetical protein